MILILYLYLRCKDPRRRLSLSMITGIVRIDYTTSASMRDRRRKQMLLGTDTRLYSSTNHKAYLARLRETAWKEVRDESNELW